MNSRVRLAYIFGLVFLILSSGLRLALAFRSWRPLGGELLMVLKAMSCGLVMDLVTLSYVGIPYLALLVLAPQRLYSSKRFTPFLHIGSLGSLYLLIFTLVAEWFFFEEFGARFNFIAVDYLIYTQEVLTNIWESYPLTPILLGILLFSVALWLPLRREIKLSQSFSDPLRRRALLSSPWILAACLFSQVADLNWTQISQNMYANEIASNGIYSFFSAFKANEIDYGSFYPTLPEERVWTRLRKALSEPGVQFISSDPWDLRRTVSPIGASLEKRLNVVLIVVESLSGEFLGTLGSKKPLTPRLDEIADQALLFTNFYATGTRTDRGLEAITLSVPPTPGRSLLKRPGNEDLFSLGQIFRQKGYQVEFIYGGYGYFDNMNHFFSHNGFHVVDRGDFSSEEVTFSNAWGVCDEDIYRKAISRIRLSGQKGIPFFGLILTTSNHRPYTYPEGRVKIPPGKGRAGAVLYTDWAIGNFFQEARKEPWFEDTVFVIVADHCANSAGKVELPIHRYRIPLIIYSPKWVKRGKVETLGGQMDLAPTLLGILGFHYESKFMGRDLLRVPPEEGRAFVATYQKLGFSKGGKLVVLDVKKSPKVFSWIPGSKDLKPAQADDDLCEEAISFYEGASLLHHRGLDKWEGGPLQGYGRSWKGAGEG